MEAVLAYRYGLFFAIAAAGVAADVATKSWIFNWLGMPGQRDVFWVWQDRVGLQTSLNEGALFGIGQGGVPVFAALSVLAALGILFWLFRGGAARDLLLTVALACIMAGILGNLYDRLGLPGLVLHGKPVHAVRDWILVMIFDRPWPNFNVADSTLVCGAILMVWHAWRHEEEAKPDASGAVASRSRDAG
jgi:signal peptidase II